MFSMLYQRTSYLNKDITCLFGRKVIEYDIASAGYNICRHFHFLPDSILDELGKMDKHNRHIAIGKLMRGNDDLKVNMKKGFAACRKKFFMENNIEDDDILSIKKDAIFLIDREVDNTKFDTIEFVKKNEFDSYIYMNKFEFYINQTECQCKGINDIVLDLHKDYMLDAIIEFCNLMRFATKEKQLSFIYEFAEAYRNHELDAGYYRELNQESLFRLRKKVIVCGSPVGLRFFDMDKKFLDISYNYTHYIIPMFQMVI